MSADNGIYILKTRDQYRVAHLCAIANIYESYLNEECEEPVPERVVEMWGKSRFTRKREVALHIAANMLEDLSRCEYGIQMIKIDKTWKEIVMISKHEAVLELDIMRRQRSCESWKLRKLERIVSGEYLSNMRQRGRGVPKGCQKERFP